MHNRILRKSKDISHEQIKYKLISKATPLNKKISQKEANTYFQIIQYTLCDRSNNF